MLFLAMLPIAATLALMLCGRPAWQAALAGLIGAVAAVALGFPIPVARIPALVGEWVPVLAEVLLIIFGGLWLSEVNRRTGRQERLARWLQDTLGSGVAAALAVVHGVTPFAESLTGFGIGVTISIPLLIQLGFDSRRAATIGLLGLCAVPWGSMGPGTLIAAGLSGLDFGVLGTASAVANGPVFMVVGIVVAVITSRRGRRGRAVSGALSSTLVLWTATWSANLVLGTPPAGAVGALVTVAAHLVFHRLRGARIRIQRGMLVALSGYAVLLGGILAGTAVIAALGPGPWHPLASPALWLLLAVLLTTPRGELKGSGRVSLRKWLGTGPVTAALVVLGIVMASSGMAAELARAAASIGPGYAFVLPFVAALGGYLTGSNSAANAMFAAPQSQIIGLLGLPQLPAMAVHNVASSLLLMGSPAKIELAAQLCPDPEAGRQSMRMVLLTDLIIVAVLGVGLLLISCLIA